MHAEGLSSTQLPPLPATEIHGLRRYPDQPVLRNEISERGMTANREEREALVPTHSGALALPALEITWWNTREDHLEHSSLPARTLQVEDNPALSADTPVGDSSASNARVWPWQLATLVLALTTLLGFALWWRARSQPAVLRATQSGPSPRSLLDDLKRACQANDPRPLVRRLTPGHASSRKPWPRWPPVSYPCPMPWMASMAPCTAKAASIGKATSCGAPSAPSHRPSRF